MTIVSEISLTTPLILTLVSFGGFGATALECSALAGAVEVPSAAKAPTLKIKTKNATNTIRCFILSSLLIVYLLSIFTQSLGDVTLWLLIYNAIG
jgi:hypothetical protein